MLKINADKRGKLVSINDILQDIPFNVKRMMHISDVPDGDTRGYHAHKQNKQLLMCFAGTVEVKTIAKDDSGALVEQNHVLNEGDFLYTPEMTWGEQTYYNNAILNVLCSEKYNEEDYIRDYEEFKQN